MSQLDLQEQFVDGALFTEMVRSGASELRSSVAEINELNVFPVPDGDTGDNMRMTLESGLSALEKISSDDLAEVLKVLSHGMLLGARGNSGVILSQFFAGIAGSLNSCKKADARLLGNALMNGVKQAYASVMTPKEGTILTVAREATEYAVARITSGSTIRSLFADLILEMQQSLTRTPELLPILKEAGVIDSGGAGLLHIMNGFNRVLNGEQADFDRDFSAETAAEVSPAVGAVNIDAFGADSVLTWGYCTEFLLRLQNCKVDLQTFDHSVITDFLQTVGDSIVAFRTDSIVKVHVHTKTPEKVLEFCHQFGEFLTLKIENMSIQHSDTEKMSFEEPEDVPAAAPKKRYGTVMVCSGKGIHDTFLDLGADYVVDGEQTQNPSTNDFLTAFRSINAEHIFVFPNNSNIILAARQAADIYKEAEIHVIETANIGEGYVALPAVVENESPETIMNRMKEAIACVSEGEITTSVRDTDLYGLHICRGDSIGISQKQIVVSDPNRLTAVSQLLVRLLAQEDKAVLTLFVGSEVPETEKEAVLAFLAQHYPDLEVYCIDGEQQVYPYILIAE